MRTRTAWLNWCRVSREMPSPRAWATYVDVQEELGVCAALEVDPGRRVWFLVCEDRCQVVWSLLVETVYLREVQVLQERDLFRQRE